MKLPSLLKAGTQVIIPKSYYKATILKVNKDKRVYLVRYIDENGTTIIKQLGTEDVLTPETYELVQTRHNRMATFLKAVREDNDSKNQVDSDPNPENPNQE